MRQVFHHHSLWEDARGGMYLPTSCAPAFHEMLARAILADPQTFARCASEMVSCWGYSAEHNLTNRSRNRRAWVGQATCCFVAGCPDYTVKNAWHRLTREQQDLANVVADGVILRWEERNMREMKCQNATLD